MTRLGRTATCLLVVIAAAACSSSSSSSSAHTAAPTTVTTATATTAGGQLVPSGPGPHLVNADGYPDHWHAALGVNVCGAWQPGPVWQDLLGLGSPARHDDPSVYAGLHTHVLADGTSDGMIHMEPNQPDEAGRNATLGRYMEFGGWHVSATAMRLWPGADHKAIVETNGDACNGRPSVVRWATATFVPGRPTRLVEQHGDPSRLHLTDNQVIALYFVPSTTALDSLGGVPSIKNLPSAQTP